MTRRLRIAVIACDERDEVPRSFRKKNRGISRILNMRLYEIAQDQKLSLTIVTHDIRKRYYDLPLSDDYQALIISGSMADISDEHDTVWMQRLIEFIKNTHGERPMLGICFGHQAIGRAFDSHLEDLPVPAEGFYPVNLTNEGKKDPLFADLPDRFMALFSHGQYITPSPGAVLVESDSPSVQAFRIGELGIKEKPTWGIQFHPDFAPETVRSALIARRLEFENRDLDVDKAQQRLNIPDEEREDTKTLVNFVKYVSEL